MTLAELNKIPENIFVEEMQKCCGSTSWVKAMLTARPFNNPEELLKQAKEAWENTNEQDWLEAFEHHPKIGDLKSLENKFASTRAMAGTEQASVETATTEVLHSLANGNTDYEKKFGFIFIVCATGKTAAEMLELLQSRLPNDRNTELKNAAAEQQKITQLRLKKILS